MSEVMCKNSDSETFFLDTTKFFRGSNYTSFKKPRTEQLLALKFGDTNISWKNQFEIGAILSWGCGYSNCPFKNK